MLRRRSCWGVLWTSAAMRKARNPGQLVGRVWDRRQYALPDTEPQRALLFMTRTQARAWCRDEMAKLHETGVPALQAIRLRPIRVVEEVRLA